ncbi:MAG TPA: cbb3-type cytochrome oxidase assembly protein CcoS [Polyangia bacterium]
MSVIYVLLPLAFALGIAAVWAFVRATRAGQFDDLDTPAHRILHDDEGEPNAPSEAADSQSTSRGGAG